MQLYYFLAIILSLCLGSLPPSGHQFGPALTFSGLIIAAWFLLCQMSFRMVINLIDRGEVAEEIGFRWFDRQTQGLRWLSLGLISLCLGGFGLGRNWTELPYIGNWMSLQAVVLLAPALMMMTGLWAAEYQFARRLGFAPAGIASMARSILSSMRVCVGWLVIPILGCMLAIDLAHLLQIQANLPSWFGWLAVCVTVLFGAPFLVRRVFPSISGDSEQLLWMHSVLKAAGMGDCRIVIWDTGLRSHNAMIAGLWGKFRIVLVSDRLVTELSPAELAMVLLHESAHARRHHIPLRIGALIPAWLLGIWIESGIDAFGPSSAYAGWGGTLGGLSSILATVLILRWVGYRSEYDADAYACQMAPRLAAECQGVPDTASQAQMALATALLKVTEDSDAARKPTWLHPGIADRITAISGGAG